MKELKFTKDNLKEMSDFDYYWDHDQNYNQPKVVKKLLSDNGFEVDDDICLNLCTEDYVIELHHVIRSLAGALHVQMDSVDKLTMDLKTKLIDDLIDDLKNEIERRVDDIEKDFYSTDQY